MPACAGIRFANELHELHELGFWHTVGVPKPFCFVEYFSCNSCNSLEKKPLERSVRE